MSVWINDLSLKLKNTDTTWYIIKRFIDHRYRNKNSIQNVSSHNLHLVYLICYSGSIISEQKIGHRI